MEVMATCLDKLLKHLSQRGRRGIPEAIIGKITLSVVKALDYLKETHVNYLSLTLTIHYIIR